MKTILKLRTFLILTAVLVAGLVCSAAFAQGAGLPALLKIISANDSAAKNDTENAERKFAFNYGASVTGLTPGTKARVWFPIAQPNAQQQVEVRNINAPVAVEQNVDPDYGNLIGYFETEVNDAGEFAFNIDYLVVRQESSLSGSTVRLTDEERERFLRANSLVPVDGRPLELIADRELPGETDATGRALYDVVREHMAYDKTNPGYGNGDSVWACNSRTGNCTDFHSLFISLARSRSIPARFEIGFPLPPDQQSGTIGGYHCWAWFHSQTSGWVPVDISEADKHPGMRDYYFGNLTADRLAMTTGRDIRLVPEPASGPLNYFVYPFVEVDGEPLDREQINPVFAFENVVVQEADETNPGEQGSEKHGSNKAMSTTTPDTD